MTAHASLSPSASERWLNCPGGLLPSLEIPRTTSEYAEEGTLAHSWLERLLNGEDITELAFDNMEMYEHVVEAGEFIITTLEGLIPASESRVDIFKVKNTACFGTVDAYGLLGDTLHVFDFKYGKGVKVSAFENSQMMLYAWGILQKYPRGTIKDIQVHIVQPRIQNYSMYVISTSELAEWINDYAKPTAVLAVTGRGAVVAGDHCVFCPLKGRCVATSFINELNNEYKSLGQYAELSNEDKITASKKRVALSKWLNDVEQALIADLESGRVVDDKVEVYEKARPIRIKDEKEALRILTEAGVENITSVKIPPYGQLKKYADLLTDVIETPTTKTLRFLDEEDS